MNEYGLIFTKRSRYAPKMVKNISSRMSLFVDRLGHSSRKEGRVTMHIVDIDFSRLMIYVQQVKEEKHFTNKKDNTGN